MEKSVLRRAAPTSGLIAPPSRSNVKGLIYKREKNFVLASDFLVNFFP